jgi:hypothetical protein
MKRTVAGYGLGLALLVSSSIAFGAGEQFGQIAGTVTEAETGVPIADATITATSRALLGPPRVVTTAEDGRYQLIDLPPGRYDVAVSYAGVKPIQRRVMVRLGETAPVDVKWSVELAAAEVTVVHEERHMTRPDSTQTGTVVTAETEGKLASQRRYQFLAQQVAGVSGGINPNVKGAQEVSNRYLVDGLDITDPVSDTFSANINFDSVASEEVLTGGMEAQYNSLGGVINLITAGGSDEFSVDTSVYVNNQHFSAPARNGASLYNGYRQFSDQPAAPNQSYQANLNVGGPILKHKLWFHASIEYLYEQGFVDPSGPPINLQHPAYYRHQILARLKLSFAPTPKHRLSLSVSADPAFLSNMDARYNGLSNYELGGAENHQDQGGFFATLQWDYYHSKDINAGIQAGFQYSLIDYGPQGILGTVDYGPRGSFSDRNFMYNPNQALHINQDDGTQWYQGDKLSHDRNYVVAVDPTLSVRGRLLGTHEAKFGIQSRFVAHTLSQHVPGGSVFHDAGGGALEGGLCQNDQTLNVPGDPTGKGCYQRTDTDDFHNQQWGVGVGAFAQDRWKPWKRLTVLPGIRFDWGTTRNSVGETVSNFFGVGPRLGATLDLSGDQKTIFSVFYGRANETLSLAAASNADVTAVSTTYQWNNGKWDKQYTSGGAGGYRLDPGATPPHSDEVTASLRREVFRDSVAGVEYTYKRMSNIWDGVEVNQIWNPSGTHVVGYVNGIPEQITKYTTPDQNYRIYQGIDFTFESHPSDALDLYLAYTLSWLYGPGAESLGRINSDLSSSGFYNPRQTMFYDGFLPEDHRHQLKLRGSYTFHGVSLGLFLNYLTGSPLSKQFFNATDGDYTIKRSPQGTDPGTGNDAKAISEFRTPDLLQIDTRIAWDLHPLIHQHLVLIADLFNLFNLSGATSVTNNDVPTFGTAAGRQSPLRFQIGLRYNH